MISKKKYSFFQDKFPAFNRDFLNGSERLTCIGSGALGGKAQGLAFIAQVLQSEFQVENFPEIAVNIPTMAVICSDVFDAFMQRNDLHDVAFSDLPDDRIAHAFQKASLPAEILGDLRALMDQVQTPLAIRSSSILEDAMYQPFAGVYATKMIPNNQHSPDSRFQKLLEAIKFVYASTYFKSAKDYSRATGQVNDTEKMGVIIQEVVGQRHGSRFYPDISGVARSYNYYATGRAQTQDGVVNLALGLGKTIVDGGISWSYSPVYPKIGPPFNSLAEQLKQTQTRFWAVNMGKPPAYDPIKETEYLLKSELQAAEEDGTLRYAASTLDPDASRIVPGISRDGPRILNFAMMLTFNEPPLNDLLRSLLACCEKALATPVEIEFAMTFHPHRFGFLQVRPMVVSSEHIAIATEALSGENVLAASENALGNGSLEMVRDVVYIKPDNFLAKFTPLIAEELEAVNTALVANQFPYLLIGFGRWGSSDPWLGIPVNWGQISGAKAIVEAAGERMNVDFSQGSHFFHNLTSLQVFYFSMPFAGSYQIDWDWLAQQPAVSETRFIRHIRLSRPLKIKVDGRSGRGIICKA